MCSNTVSRCATSTLSAPGLSRFTQVRQNLQKRDVWRCARFSHKCSSHANRLVRSPRIIVKDAGRVLKNGACPKEVRAFKCWGGGWLLGIVCNECLVGESPSLMQVRRQWSWHRLPQRSHGFKYPKTTLCSHTPQYTARPARCIQQDADIIKNYLRRCIMHVKGTDSNVPRDYLYLVICLRTVSFLTHRTRRKAEEALRTAPETCNAVSFESVVVRPCGVAASRPDVVIHE